MSDSLDTIANKKILLERYDGVKWEHLTGKKVFAKRYLKGRIAVERLAALKS